MKKIMNLLAIVVVFFTFFTFASCCSSSNTPSSVVESAQKAVEKKDYKKFVEYIYVDGSAEEQEAAREQLASMIEGKAKQSADEVTHPMRVISEEISEDGQTAKVVVEETNPDGTTEQSTHKLRKDANGDWKIEISK